MRLDAYWRCPGSLDRLFRLMRSDCFIQLSESVMNRIICLILVLSAGLLSCSGDEPPATPAEVSITFPEPGQVLTNDRVRIQGNASGATSVEVNGVSTDVNGGEWTALVPFSQGEVTAIATARDASAQVSFVVDSVTPTIVIESPERGAYTDQDSITVRGRVEETGSGLQSVDLRGQTVELDDGVFEFDWPVQPGLNELQIRARDRAGNEGTALRGVIAGPTVDPTETVDPAFQIFVREEAIDVVEEVAESLLTPEFVTEFAKESLTFDNVTLESINFAELDVQLVPRMGRLDLEVDVEGIAIDGDFSIGETNYDTTINVARLGVTIETRVQAADDGTLDFSFGDATLDLNGDDLTFMIDDLTQDDVEFLRDLVVDVARDAFGELLSEQIFDELFDPDILKRKIEILDREIVFELRFESIEVFADGIFVRTSIRMPEDSFADVREVPGALARQTSNPNGPNTTNDILFTSTHSAIDRILHGVWRTGLLNQELRGDDFAGLELPFELTSSALGLVLDSSINGLVPPDTPAGVRLRPLLPPVIGFKDEGSIGIRMGELMVDIVLFPDTGPIEIVSLAFFLDLDVSIAVDGVVISLAFDTELRADLDSEPEFDLDDEETEALFEDLVALIPQVLEQSIDLRGEADITWVKLQNPEIEIHGIDTDHVTISLEMIPSPEAL